MEPFGVVGSFFSTNSNGSDRPGMVVFFGVAKAGGRGAPEEDEEEAAEKRRADGLPAMMEDGSLGRGRRGMGGISERSDSRVVGVGRWHVSLAFVLALGVSSI
jgi:hypothetical protein